MPHLDELLGFEIGQRPREIQRDAISSIFDLPDKRGPLAVLDGLLIPSSDPLQGGWAVIDQRIETDAFVWNNNPGDTEPEYIVSPANRTTCIRFFEMRQDGTGSGGLNSVGWQLRLYPQGSTQAVTPFQVNVPSDQTNRITTFHPDPDPQDGNFDNNWELPIAGWIVPYGVQLILESSMPGESGISGQFLFYGVDLPPKLQGVHL